MAVDSAGDLFVADTANNRIVEEICTSGVYHQSIVDANGFNGPLGIAVDTSGNLYVADTGNNRIVKEAVSGNSYVASALPITGLNDPVAIAADSSGNQYISDAGNSRVLKESLVGSNYAQAAILTGIQGGQVAVDLGGSTVYLAVPGSGNVVMTSASGGSQTTVASGLSQNVGIAVDLAGVVYIADGGNGRLLRIYLTGGYNVRSTMLETPLASPSYLAIDGNDTLYFADNSGASLHALALGGYSFGSVPIGTVSSKASLLFSFDSGGSILAPSVVLQGVTGMDFKDVGTGSCTTNGGEYAYSTGATCTVDVAFTPARAGWRSGAAVLLNGSGMAIATGYVRGWGDGPQLIYQPGTVRTYTLPGQTSGQVIVADLAGNLYINHAIAAFSSDNAIYKETWTGSGFVQSLVATNLAYPLNIALDGAGNIYVLDEGAYDIFKFSPNADGTYTKTTFDQEQPNSNALAIDGAGNVYFANSDNVYIGSIQMDTPQGGYYGNRSFSVSSDPGTIAVDGNQNIFFAPDSSSDIGELARTAGNYSSVSFPGIPISYGGTVINEMGNFFILSGDSEIDELKPSGGSFQVSAVASVSAQYDSLSVDGNGNLYWLGQGTGIVQVLDFTNPPAVHFNATPAGTTSSDSPETLTITNAGGEPLQFPIPASATNPALPPGFALSTGGNPECPEVSASSSTAGVLAAGMSCQYGISYFPVDSTQSSGWMILSDNNLNQTAPAYASQSIALVVAGSPLTPTVTWNAPSNISYGTALGSTQLNATASVPGLFTYSPAAGTVLTVGTHPLSTTFTPTDTSAYSAVTKSVQVTILQTTPSITWPTPAAITYGTALSSTQLNASSPVAGSFSYSPGAGTVLTAGSQTLSVTFTPTDTADYTMATANATLIVSQVTPTITWATPAAITYGTALSAAQLDATTPVPGTFSYSSPAGTILTAGYHGITATFTPTDTTDYATATATIYLTVNQVVPTITWAAPVAITYGTALSTAQLDATASVPGTFYYSLPSGSILTAGSHMVTASFYPSDSTDYGYTTANVTLVVNKATPTITWTAPAAISYSTALGATQLNAEATGSGVYASTAVGGSFIYSPALGTVLSVGSQNLSTIFTPTDSMDYTTATASVLLTVNQARPTITWATPAAITYGTALSATQLNAASTAAGSFSYSPAAGTVLGAGSQTLQATFTPTDTADYGSATASVTLTVNPATPIITWGTPAAVAYGTALSSTQLNATASVPGTFVYNPALGTIPAAGNDTLSTTFTPADAVDYATATASVILTVSPNPAPFLGNMTPAIADAGGAAFTITVNGANFLPSSAVYWGTSALATQYVSASQLTATVTSAEIATPGATAVNVQTPAPGGGTSDVLQFEVDSSSGSATAPSAPSTAVSVTAGSTASYTISFPADVTSATATCLNLPTGALCSFSNATNVLTITTSSTTPSGTYQVTVVFAETVTSAASAGILAPFLLLPLLLLRKKLKSRGIWSAAGLGLILLGAVVYGAGCGGSSPSNTTPTTHSVKSSAVVGLTVK